MDVFKSKVFFLEYALEDAYLIDTISHDGHWWLVASWIHFLDTGARMPNEIIRMDGTVIKFQEVNEPSHRFALSNGIPRSIFDGKAKEGYELSVYPAAIFHTQGLGPKHKIIRLKKPPDITVTKLDAARRQLRTAIELWFHDGDPIAIHTLVYAAYEIVHKIFRDRGHKDLLFDSPAVAKALPDGVLQLKKSANFFKHADRDLNATIVFPSRYNNIFILKTIEGLQRMGEPLDAEGAAFQVWCHIHHPIMFAGNPKNKPFPPESRRVLSHMLKRDFYRAMTDHFGKNSK